MDFQRIGESLSSFHEIDFEGWMIGKLTYCDYLEKGSDSGCRIVKRSARLVILEVTDLVQQVRLEVTLIKPEDKSAEKRKPLIIRPDVQQPVSILSRFCASKSEILQFVNLMKDENIIHQTQHPIVPGMMMMENLCRLLEWVQGKIIIMRFLSPLYAGEEAEITLTEDGAEAATSLDKRLIWKSKIIWRMESSIA